MTRIDEMRSSAEAIYFRQQAELEASLEAQARLEELQAIGSTDGFFEGDWLPTSPMMNAPSSPSCASAS